MTHDEAFMEDICAHPDDDTPRLIYADWLDDHGQHDRAEFIRVQIERECLPEGDERQDELRRREKAIFDQHGAGWMADLPGECFPDVWSLLCVFRRGFLHWVELEPGTLLAHARSLFRIGPLSDVVLLPGGEGVEELARSQWVGRLRNLSFGQGWLWHQITPLLMADGLRGLRSLTLDAIPLASPALAHLFDAPMMANLRALSLTGAGLTANQAEQMANCPVLKDLEELNLHGNSLGTLGAQFLAGSRHLGKLHRLHLNQNQITPPGARALAGSTRLTRLSHLGLGYNPLGSAGAEAVARSTSLNELTSLDLAHIDLGRAGLSELVTAPFWTRLQSLDLQQNQLGDEAIEVLARSSPPPALAHFNLSDNEISDEGARALGRWEGLASLCSFSLRKNNLTAFGLKDLLANLDNLEELTVDQNRLGNLGLEVLSRWPGLARLWLLNVQESRNDDAGVLALLRSEHFGRPKFLHLAPVGEEALSVLHGMQDKGRVRVY